MTRAGDVWERNGIRLRVIQIQHDKAACDVMGDGIVAGWVEIQIAKLTAGWTLVAGDPS